MSRAIWRRGGAGMGSQYDMPPYIYDEVNDEFTDTATGQKFSKNSGTPVELEDNKAATITSNGTSEIEPTEGKDAMKKVTVTVAVPTKEEVAGTTTITTNTDTEITPPEGKTFSKVTVTTNVTGGAEIEANVAETIDVSQYTDPVVIEPAAGKDGMAKATVTLSNIPSGADLEANKAATIDVSQYTEPVEVTPTSGKDGMEKVTVTLSNIPSGGGDIDTTKWKVYPGYITESGQSGEPAVFLVDNTITDTGTYDVYAAEYDSDTTGPATLTHISGQTWDVQFDGCQNYEASYTDAVSDTVYTINWTAS